MTKAEVRTTTWRRLMKPLLAILGLVCALGCDRTPKNRYEYAAQEAAKREKKMSTITKRFEGKSVFAIGWSKHTDLDEFHARRDCPELLKSIVTV
ncbi:MAG: hypothetical protein HY665_06135 [Chloroflexi bacterium]|nr:hypothetical protein [Chloroflexota bacterium]